MPCPSCGAPLPWRSGALPYVTCPQCRSLVLRRGEDAEAVGKVATLPFDMSPLRIGTTFRYREIGFEIVGRVRWDWGDGAWNEWFLSSSKGPPRWLAEAMGSFMLTEETPAILSLPGLERFAQDGVIERGAVVMIDGAPFVATDVRKAICAGSEGELPRPTSEGETLFNADFRSPSGGALSLQRDAEGNSAWFGTYLDLPELHPANLRAIQGWAIPANLK